MDLQTTEWGASLYCYFTTSFLLIRYIKLFDVCCSDPEYCAHKHTSSFPVKRWKVQRCAEKEGAVSFHTRCDTWAPVFRTAPVQSTFTKSKGYWKLILTRNLTEPYLTLSFLWQFIWSWAFLFQSTVQHFILPQTMSVLCSYYM